MDFRFTEDQLLLQETVRGFLAGEVTPTVLRELWQSESARSPALWRKLAEIGLPGMCIAEQHGGMGLSESDCVLLHEECGRAALAEPVIATATVAAPMLAELGGALAVEWLPRIAKGDAIVVCGHPNLPLVEDAHIADLLLLPAPQSNNNDAPELHAVPRAQVQLQAHHSNDPSRRAAQVQFNPTTKTCAAEGARAQRLFAAAYNRGALAAAAQAVGAADTLLELAAAYVQQRRQFGKPIGSFQAVKHHLADAKVRLEYARPVVQRAACSAARADALCTAHVAMAKLAACEAAALCARKALQCHGAIGYTWEQDLHIWMRRAWSLNQMWGRAEVHLAYLRAALFAGEIPLGPGATFAGG